MKYDLHVHSSFSDGDYSPEDLVRLYKNKLDGIALTDHDTIDGVSICIEEGKKHNMNIIPGIEFSCSYKESDVHILGLGIDIYNEYLIEATNNLKKSRVLRAEKILDMLDKDGILLNRSKLLENNRVGRPHIALELVDKGFVKSIKEAFSIYLGRGRRYYVEKDSLTTKEAIDIIHLSGGKAVLAHPGDLIYLKEVLNLCLSLGIDGIEAYHPSNNLAITNDMISFSRDNNLLITAGSDFHRKLEDIGKYFINIDESFIKR